MLTQISRRHAVRGLAASLAGAVALPLSTEAATDNRRAAIELHKKALIRLLRAELPSDCNKVTIFLNASWSEDPNCQNPGSLHASATRVGWETDKRLKQGGCWVGRHQGDWYPTRGFMPGEI